LQKKVAIEKNLHNVKQMFEDQGYQVDTIDDTQIDTIGTISNYDAIIIAGGNKDFMGIEDTNTKSPIINAEGKTAQEIFKRVNG
jgi:peptidase E